MLLQLILAFCLEGLIYIWHNGVEKCVSHLWHILNSLQFPTEMRENCLSESITLISMDQDRLKSLVALTSAWLSKFKEMKKKNGKFSVNISCISDRNLRIKNRLFVNNRFYSFVRIIRSFLMFLTWISKGTFKHPLNPQSWQKCPRFYNTCWNLRSNWGCLKERAGCSMDFPAEFLSCLRSIQRRSSMSIRSPMSIPMYKLRFQPQLSARGSEVDATRNLLGTGMELSSTPPGSLMLLPLNLDLRG